MTREIHIAAAVIARPDGKVLVVRKRGSAVFMQPGGKLEPGETPLEALRRELEEEIGYVGNDAATWLGRFSASAANEADSIVIAETFTLVTAADLAPLAEIEELRWIDPADPQLPLAQLSGRHILPAFLATRR